MCYIARVGKIKHKLDVSKYCLIQSCLKLCLLHIVFTSSLSHAVIERNKGNYVSIYTGAAFPRRTIRFTFPIITTIDKEGNTSDEFVNFYERAHTSPIAGIILGINLQRTNSLELELTHAFGHKFAKNQNTTFSVEGQPGIYLAPTQYRTKIITTTLFANFKHALSKPDNTFTPYLLVGAGASANKRLTTHEQVLYTTHPDYSGLSQTYKAKRKINFAYQVGIGIAIKTYKSLKLDLAYKYRFLGSIPTLATLNTEMRGKFYTSNVTLGATYDF